MVKAWSLKGVQGNGEGQRALSQFSVAEYGAGRVRGCGTVWYGSSWGSTFLGDCMGNTREREERKA